MGKPIAKNLLKAGHQVVVSQHNEAAAAELTERGAQRGRTPAEIAAQADLVITMLRTPRRLRMSCSAPTASSKVVTTASSTSI